MNKTDSYRHQGMRKRLIQELKTKGIADERLLGVMGKIPRHYFVGIGFDDWAYKDVAFPIGEEQTISQPYTVAYQTGLLNVNSGDRILEVGTGSGYQAAVLYDMGGKVYTIERHEILYRNTEELLQKLGYGKIRTFFGDGFEGLERYAPFDKILITAAPDHTPRKLYDQLKIDGVLVFPMGKEGETQQMIRITKKEDGPKIEKFDYFRFVPMLKGVKKSGGSKE